MIADDIRKLAVQHDYRSALVTLHDFTVLSRLTLYQAVVCMNGWPRSH